ncbi:MAG: universal stress protein [Desulfitobacteriaceae bacterium]|nr:universal stress protein [Desulfitobacteriaceae bacterium]
MFDKILIPIDGSEHSMKAADAAIKLAKIDDGEVEILYVSSNVNTYRSRVVYSASTLEKELTEEAEKVIAQGAAKFKAAGVKYTTKVLSGDAADVICQEAEQNGIKVIVMGSRGLNAVSSFVLGSVTNKVLSRAHCPVFITK